MHAHRWLFTTHLAVYSLKSNHVLWYRCSVLQAVLYAEVGENTSIYETEDCDGHNCTTSTCPGARTHTVSHRLNLNLKLKSMSRQNTRQLYRMMYDVDTSSHNYDSTSHIIIWLISRFNQVVGRSHGGLTLASVAWFRDWTADVVMTSSMHVDLYGSIWMCFTIRMWFTSTFETCMPTQRAHIHMSSPLQSQLSTAFLKVLTVQSRIVTPQLKQLTI